MNKTKRKTKFMLNISKHNKNILAKEKRYKPVYALQKKECGESPFLTSESNKKEIKPFLSCTAKFWNKRSHPAYQKSLKAYKTFVKENIKCRKHNCGSLSKIQKLREKEQINIDNTCGPFPPWEQRKTKNYEKVSRCRDDLWKKSKSRQLNDEYYNCTKVKCKKITDQVNRNFEATENEREIMMERILKDMEASK